MEGQPTASVVVEERARLRRRHRFFTVHDPTLHEVERVRPNDNRQPGGTMRGGVLELRLEARVAMWHPDGDDAPGAPMPAFAEEGGAA